MTDSSTGIVYLIGAGPGDPELITLKALRTLMQSDVVLYDSLVPDEIVVLIPSDIERIYVGKRGGKPSIPQDEINRMMVKFASEGKRVARLKGSDPIIFGRGGEEARFLKENGIRFEIIPGVTSGIAGPTYAGIPCTDREKSSSVMFVTGHKAKEKLTSTVRWDWVAQAIGSTLVIYMGVSQIDSIVGELIDSGMSPDMPAAIVERATFPTQRSFKCKLSELPEAARAHEIKAPTLFVIGEVVDLQPYMSWIEKKPLTGVRVMVLRAAEQAVDTYRMLRDLGAEVIPYPTIEIAEHTDDDAWDKFDLVDNDYRWLIFTSENGVRFFVNQFLDRYGDIRQLALFSIAAVGSGTAKALSEFGIDPDFVPEKATVSAFANEFAQYVDLEGVAVVRVRGNLGDDTFEEIAAAEGADVLPLKVYETSYYKWPADFKDRLFEYPPDAIMFTAGSTVDGLFENLTDGEMSRLLSTAGVFSMGPSTSKKLRRRGLEVTAEADPHTIPALIDAIVAHFGKE